MATKSVFIGGGGPAGLAAALLFQQLGWDEVVLVEARSGPQDFEKNRAFNYLIDARGQRLLRRLGIAERLHDYGVLTTGFVATTIAADGKVSVAKPPIIDPERPPAFWSTRRNILTMLHEALEQRNDGRVKVLYEHQVAGFEHSDTGAAQVIVDAPDGSQKRFSPDLILACDGLSSALRMEAEKLPEVAPGHFAMQQHPSISAELYYKVLNLPHRFTANDGEFAVDDHHMTYVITSRHKDLQKACALFSFPVANSEHPRTVNLIRERDHVLWTITEPTELLDYLADAFPQLDIRALISEAEARDFVSLAPGRFPQPQYSRSLHARLGSGEHTSDLVLIGDAAHAFPPDLGMGVNSAFEDIEKLEEFLPEGDYDKASITAYAKARLPEAAALVRLVQSTFPQQYNTRPWAVRRWAAGFVANTALHKAAPSLFDRPAFLLGANGASQLHRDRAPRKAHEAQHAADRHWRRRTRAGRRGLVRGATTQALRERAEAVSLRPSPSLAADCGLLLFRPPGCAAHDMAQIAGSGRPPWPASPPNAARR